MPCMKGGRGGLSPEECRHVSWGDAQCGTRARERRARGRRVFQAGSDSVFGLRRLDEH